MSVTYGQEPSPQCLQNNDDVTLTCIVNPLTRTVDWFYDKTLMTTCSIQADNMCFRLDGTTVNPRRFFSTSLQSNYVEFTIRINPVSPYTDAGVYKCEHYGESDSVTLDACGRFPCIFIYL